MSSLADMAPAVPGNSVLLYILVVIITGGGLELLRWAYQRLVKGKADDALEIAQAAQAVARDSHALFVGYRVELEDAKATIHQYLQELISVNKELGAAVARINALEEELRTARSESVTLHEELARAHAKREELLARIDDLKTRIHLLETQS